MAPVDVSNEPRLNGLPTTAALPRIPRSRSILPVLLALAHLAAPPIWGTDAYVDNMKFAAEMARRGNWREALYRWQKAAVVSPNNPKIQNNLGVAHEALGNVAQAMLHYDQAIGWKGEQSVVATNRARAERFWSQVEDAGDAEVPTYAPSGIVPGDAEGLSSAKKKGKTFRATVKLPVPARIDLGTRRKLLVASFRTDESHLLDINRELVRFIRSELSKRTELDVLDVTPPPAIPEQSLADMIRNDEFWKHLGNEYDADVIVSGIMEYSRRDSSSFEDVDIVSATTGQKVRQTQFVEQELFAYGMDVIFMDGRTGELLFRDRLQRSSVFRGSQNDPITAFYDLSDSIAPDLLAIVKPRVREDVRFVFKK